MISSEVQRTLVKSPPELWTELSDPESLARHLGDLGEIRITRTEPENLVEWEAEGTTGTVEIAPSGWGTKVKLTVVRELPAEAGEEQASGAEDSGAETALESETASDVTAPLHVDAAPSEADDAAASEMNEPAETETGTAALSESTPESPLAERKPAPATEAARRAAGWPASGRTPGPAIESDLRAAEALEGAPAQPDGMHEWAAQAIAPHEGDLDAEYVPEEEPDPPKRGLFARLFGWRRGRAKAAPLDEPTLEPDAFDDYDEPTLERDESGATEETALADTPIPAAPELEAEVTEYAASVTEEPGGTTTSEQIEPELTDLEALGAHEPELADVEALSAHESEADAQDATATQPAEPPAGQETGGEIEPVTPVEDLAAELRAAEEVDAERVEAVLTAVLDRLGSAHHRPFSRP